MSNQRPLDLARVAKVSDRTIITKLEKRKVYSPFIDNIYGADFVDIQLISKFSEEIYFSLCVIGIFSTYVWVIPLNDRKGITSNNVFQQILDKYNHEPNKIWVDQGNEFYSRSIKSWLQDKNKEM